MRRIGKAKRRIGTAILCILVFFLAGIVAHSAGRTTDSTLATTDTSALQRTVAHLEARSNWGLASKEPISGGAWEVWDKDSIAEKVVKRISQYRPHWLKVWSFPVLLVLTGIGILLLLL